MARARDLLDRVRDDARAGLAVLVAVAVVAGFVWYRIGVSGGDDLPPRRVSSARGADVPGNVGSTTTTRGDVLVVHVAGAVSTPGVVELEPGARVIDAVEAAGGADDDADLDRLNLAAKLADGERVLVQHVGDPPAPGSAGADGPAAAPGSPASGGLVNLNTASSAELDALPGIGPTLAAAIIAERQRKGGFHSVQELRDVRGIGDKRFGDLVDLVTV